ncbi:MAG: sigma-70 family RNA polymerase sigma factor [Proteobacteria bacterium]|nr:sigma-70 family RNA polymerase sigma factor [Pseudomonadota bacterium]
MLNFQNGDREAFEAIYRKYKNPIFSFLCRQYTTQETAKELTQEVFYRVIRGARTFRFGSCFATWIYTIARNLGIDSTRKARHRKCASLDQKTDRDGPPLGDRLAHSGPGPDRASAAGRIKKDIAQAISKLPDEQREVFLLREYHGLPFREIANVVNSKEGTVKSRMRYALETLRVELSEWTDYARTLP